MGNHSLPETDARKLKAEADLAEYEAELKRLEVEAKRRELDLPNSGPFEYLFTKPVDDKSVKKALRRLREWDQEDSSAPIRFVINSPGGNSEVGMHLFDELVGLSRRGGGGHSLTTVVRGEACSMGAILSQAGDTRLMGASSMLMIHEASWGVWGTPGKFQDNKDFLDRFSGYMADIFCARSHCSRQQFLSSVHRRDWWLTAREALDIGFVDRIG